MLQCRRNSDRVDNRITGCASFNDWASLASMHATTSRWNVCPATCLASCHTGAQQLHDITEHASQVQCAALCCRVSIPGDTEQSQSTTPGRGPAWVMCRCDSVAFTTLRFIQLSHAAYSLDMPLL
jgi:hypothetical protein